MSEDFSPFEYAENRFSDSLENDLREAGLSKANFKMAIKAYKTERLLDIYCGSGSENMKIFKTYPFTGYSGKLGPKTQEGDRQIPEGHYFINRFNPKSKFFLSLGLNYPNTNDVNRALKDEIANPGSDIFIHGSNQTIGCIPVGNEKISELYLLASWAKSSGQSLIPVSIFPFKNTKGALEKYSSTMPEYKDFWEKLFAEK